MKFDFNPIPDNIQRRALVNAAMNILVGGKLME
jgi:hypothetical protein